MSSEKASANRGTPGGLALGAGAICLATGFVMSVVPGWILGRF